MIENLVITLSIRPSRFVSSAYLVYSPIFFEVGIPNLVCGCIVEIDHEIISTAILLLSNDSIRVVVSYKQKFVHEVLVNRLVKLAQEKSVVK